MRYVSRILILAASGYTIGPLAAQCNLQVTWVDNTVVSYSTTATASWTGGTPPYSIVFTSSNNPGPQWSGYNGTTSSTNYSKTQDVQSSCSWPLGSVTATVTDAQGCQASGNAMIPNITVYFGDWVGTPLHDCATGQYRFRFVSAGCSNGSWPLYLNGAIVPRTYQGNNVWHSNQTYPQGVHQVFVGDPSYGNYWYIIPGAMGLNRPLNPITITIPPPTTPGECGVNFKLRAALSGALPTGTIMTDSLRSNGLIPVTEPYSALGYVYTGSSPNTAIPAAMLAVTGNDAIVDWLVVELRSPTAPYGVLYSKPVLLQRDGDVIDTDGDAYIATSLATGSYRVALRHRNHLGIMTGTARTLSSDPSPTASLIDFRSASTSMYGTTPRKQVGTVWCMWAGDADGNGTLAYTNANNDRDPILTALGGNIVTNVLTNQYSRLDVNLDGVVKYVGPNNDRDPILVNVGGTTPTNTRIQQLP